MEPEGKIAIVTGAAGGIGLALPRSLLAAGAKGVAMADLQAGPLEEAAAQIGGLAIPTDVSDEAAVRALVQQTEAELGPVDLFISNAGIGPEPPQATPSVA